MGRAAAANNGDGKIGSASKCWRQGVAWQECRGLAILLWRVHPLVGFCVAGHGAALGQLVWAAVAGKQAEAGKQSSALCCKGSKGPPASLAWHAGAPATSHLGLLAGSV